MKRNKTMMVLVLSFFFISVIPSVDANTGSVVKEWDMMFGGSEADFGFSVQQTSDGGYIIVGSTKSYGAGESDVWLIKTDSEGILQWNKTFGGSEDDVGYSVQQTSDGGYITVVTTESYGAGEEDVWLIKTDSNGNEEWDMMFGGSEADFGFSVQQTSDGGYIIAGCHLGDLWLIKTDSNGNEEWSRTFEESVIILGFPVYNLGYSVQQISDDGYIITGLTGPYCIIMVGSPLQLPFQSCEGGDVWLIKTDSNGYLEWRRTFGMRDPVDFGYSVQQTSDSGYIIVGSTESYGASEDDIWLIKTDSNGNEEWNKTFGKSNSVDFGYSVQQTSDDGYIITGYTEPSSAGESDAWIIKTDLNGNEEWNKTFGGSDFDAATSVQQTSDSGYIITGSTKSYGAGESDVWLLKATVIGSLSISSKPADAEIYLDGNPKGTTPKTITNVSVGSYALKLTKEGYEDYSENIIVSTGKTTTVLVNLTLIPLPSTPEHAQTPTESPVTEEKEVPGFEAVFAIAGLLVFTFLLRER